MIIDSILHEKSKHNFPSLVYPKIKIFFSVNVCNNNRADDMVKDQEKRLHGFVLTKGENL